ncbi:glycosyltransferase [Maribellus sp. CM-23]|uniref:glycosyltransferase n=1 Tax=Maribellus sp. CM-23 TaxID=2781026 RepID=UPI001F15DAA1|nr:glycosyltransferase [Maribellus sp. CM-23]MCE4566484.1 glycosyltransferase [Maribellus sp. CM-23]
MKLLINTSNLKKGGALQVAHSFLTEIKENTEHFFHVVLSTALSEQINTQEFSPNFTFYNYAIDLGILNITIGKDSFLDSLENKIKPDKVFSVFGPTYWKPKTTHIAGYAKPQYIYKNSPFFDILSTKEKFKLKISEIIHLHNFKRFCDILITETHDVTSSLQKIFGNKKQIYTVTNFYNQIFDTPHLWSKEIQLPDFDGYSLLTIASNYPHKNLNIIPKVVKHLMHKEPEMKFRFILTIDKSELNEQNPEVLNHIVFLGKVNIYQCPNLYKQVDFMFLPTLLECFSASYPEAMRMEKPILTSNLSFAQGLCGGAAVYFNPLNPEDIANKISELINNKDKQKEIIKNGVKQLRNFDTASERARKYIEIIEHA